MRLKAAAMVLFLLGAGLPLRAHADVAMTGIFDDTKLIKFSVSGAISKDDAPRFEKIATFLAEKQPFRDWQFVVTLNSPGGDVLAAMAIGNVIRNNWFWTFVEDDATCASACVLVFAAGAQRMLGSHTTVAIHRPYFEPEQFAGLDQPHAKAKYDELTATVKAYLLKMGMPDQLFAQMMQVSSGDARVLSEYEMNEMSLLGQDPGYAEWKRAQAVTKYGAALWQQHLDWSDREISYAQSCVARRGRSDDDLQAWSECMKQFQRSSPDPIAGK